MTNDTPELPSHTPQDPVPPQAPLPGNSANPEPLIPVSTASSAGLIVLQWMTYILWQGVLITLGILLTTSLRFFVLEDAGDQTYAVYLLAIHLCLLPFALLADRFYAQREPLHKHGLAAIIMAFYAVLAFIVMLVSLITAVTTAVAILIETGSTDEKVVIIISAFVITVLGSLFFVRVLRPERLLRLSRFFPFAVLAISAIALILTLVGPLKSSLETRDDRLVESGLPTLSNQIQTYANTNNRLPANLRDLSLNGTYESDAKLLIDRNLVSYRILESSNGPQTPDSEKPTSSSGRTSVPNRRRDPSRSRYELCVTYKRAKNSNSSRLEGRPSDEPLTYIDTYSHPAGRQCYSLQTYTAVSMPEPLMNNGSSQPEGRS